MSPGRRKQSAEIVPGLPDELTKGPPAQALSRLPIVEFDENATRDPRRYSLGTEQFIIDQLMRRVVDRLQRLDRKIERMENGRPVKGDMKSVVAEARECELILAKMAEISTAAQEKSLNMALKMANVMLPEQIPDLVTVVEDCIDEGIKATPRITKDRGCILKRNISDRLRAKLLSGTR